jgi:hypothetical protein
MIGRVVHAEGFHRTDNILDGEEAGAVHLAWGATVWPSLGA